MKSRNENLAKFQNTPEKVRIRYGVEATSSKDDSEMKLFDN